jgi:hypothetical protein
MNSKYTFGIIALTVGVIVGTVIYPLYNRATRKAHSPAQLRLEEILSIKELHLVRHRYTDLFYLHRKGHPDKAVRAVVQVPVSITAFIDLRHIRLVKSNDSIRAIILPKAVLELPHYEIEKMTITKTRSFQLHAGRDLYPDVSTYLQKTMTARRDSISTIAMENHILVQAETEARVYVESLLKALGRQEITVTISDTLSAPAQKLVYHREPAARSFRPDQELYMGMITLGF